MNRRERRGRAKQVRSSSGSLAKATAIHEAGHAVARFVTARELGFEAEEAIFYMEIDLDPHPRPTLDGKAMVSASGVTFGPNYSRPMMDYLKANPVPQSLDPPDPAVALAQVTACKAAGIDVARWASLKVLAYLAGPAAEAKFLGKMPSEVLKGYECEDDKAYAVGACKLAGLTDEEAAEIIDHGLSQASEIFDEPKAWRAVEALADSLACAGRLDGKPAVAIIRAAFSMDQ
jgi:hypothetical protein